MEKELKDPLLKLVNYQISLSTKRADFRDGMRVHLLPRQWKDHGWGMSLEIWSMEEGICSGVTWSFTGSGRVLLGNFGKGRPIGEEYVEIDHFFTDIHHPTDDELDLLGVVHPWAPPAILLLGEGLEYL